jgi:hypothetical protein
MAASATSTDAGAPSTTQDGERQTRRGRGARVEPIDASLESSTPPPPARKAPVATTTTMGVPLGFDDLMKYVLLIRVVTCGR